jgi:SSS family solute:Na+ symporter
VALIIAVVAAKPLLGSLDQAFQFIQEYTGFISPAIFALFFYGIFWKRTTSNSVLIASVLSIPISALLKYMYPDLPFLDRIGIVFLILSAIIVVVSLAESKKSHARAIDLNEISFKTDWVFNTLSAGLIVILIVLYSIFW